MFFLFREGVQVLTTRFVIRVNGRRKHETKKRYELILLFKGDPEGLLLFLYRDDHDARL